MIKKIILGLFLIFGVTNIFADWDSLGLPYNGIDIKEDANSTDLSKESTSVTLSGAQSAQDGGIAQQILSAYGLKGTDNGALDYVKFAINLTLSLLFFACVAYLIYGFYMILVSGKSEDAYKKAIKILWAAGVGIVLVGLSFFIAQIMFGIFFKAKGSTNATANTTDKINVNVAPSTVTTNTDGGVLGPSLGGNSGPSRCDQYGDAFKKCLVTDTEARCEAAYKIKFVGVICFEISIGTN